MTQHSNNHQPDDPGTSGETFPETEALFVNALYSRRNTGGFSDLGDLIGTAYVNDINGGPETQQCGSVYMIKLRQKLNPIGWTVTLNIGRPRSGYRLAALDKKHT